MLYINREITQNVRNLLITVFLEAPLQSNVKASTFENNYASELFLNKSGSGKTIILCKGVDIKLSHSKLSQVIINVLAILAFDYI